MAEAYVRPRQAARRASDGGGSSSKLSSKKDNDYDVEVGACHAQQRHRCATEEGLQRL